MQAAFFYVITYAFIVLNIFLILIVLRKPNGELLQTLVEVKGIARSNPYLGIFLTTNMFSLAGIPPLAGFFSKLFIIKALIDANLSFVPILVVFLSVIAAVYYIRVVRFIVF